MTIRHLQVFSQVCSCGSVTAAAKKLFITQPAASSAIAELEAHYGIRLFDRIGRRLYITETGKRFLDYASHILSLFDELEQVRDWEEGGLLRVGASITVGNHLLPEIVRVFQQQHPAAAVKAVVDNSETIEERVIHNEIDLGLIEGVVHSPQIESRTFFHDRMVLIVPPGYADEREALPVNVLGEFPLLLREKGSAGREIVDGILSVHGIPAEPTWQSVSTQAIVQAVSRGLGISLLPELLVREAAQRGEVSCAELQDVSLERDYSVIWHREKFLSPILREWIRLCLSIKTADGTNQRV